MADEANLIIPLQRSLCFGFVSLSVFFWPHIYLICKLRYYQRAQMRGKEMKGGKHEEYLLVLAKKREIVPFEATST